MLGDISHFDLNRDAKVCDCCGTASLRASNSIELFNYKNENGEVVQLSAPVVVWSCSECGDSFTDGNAEDARHEAVCKYLGRLSPSQLRDLREGYGQTQAGWAELTGFGIASIKRWESGAFIQNAANDRFLRLLRKRKIFDELRALALQSGEAVRTAETIGDRGAATAVVQGAIISKFRTTFSPVVCTRAASFELRATRGRVAA